MCVHNSNCMFHVNIYPSMTKVSIIKEDLMMMMIPAYLGGGGTGFKVPPIESVC